jgi:ATP adenylyltransferase
MSTDNPCFYCANDERLRDLMIEICPLKVSTLYLFKEQTYRGRCIVAYKDHKGELYQLTEKELELYIKDVSKAASAVNKVFSPDKINYGAFADKVPHLHFHIVPKYKDGHTWGGTFEMMPQDKVYLQEDDYNDMIKKIRASL